MIKRVTLAELLDLADVITRLGNRGQVSGITNKLGDALVDVLEAAKTAAFNEALEAHLRAEPTQAGSTGTEE